MKEERRKLLEFFSYHDKKNLVRLERAILQRYEDAKHYDKDTFLLKA